MEDLEDIARQQTYKPRRLKKKLDTEAEKLFLTLQDLCHFQVIRMCCQVAENMSIGMMAKIWSNSENNFEAARKLILQTTMNNQNFKQWQNSLQTLPITILDEIKAIFDELCEEPIFSFVRRGEMKGKQSVPKNINSCIKSLGERSILNSYVACSKRVRI